MMKKLILASLSITFLILPAWTTAARQQEKPKKKSLILTNEDIGPDIVPKNENARPDKTQKVELGDAVSTNGVIYLLDKVSTFRLNITTTGALTVEQKFEFCQPDRIRVTPPYYAESGGPDEEIVIGDRLYSRFSSKAIWSKSDSHLKGSITSYALRNRLPFFIYKKVGGVTLDGVSSVMYTRDETSSDSSTPKTVNSSIWFGESDGLPLMISLSDSASGWTMVFKFTDYDQPIKIEPPM